MFSELHFYSSYIIQLTYIQLHQSVILLKSHSIIHDMESQLVINISDYCAAEMYGEPEVQVFPKQLKPITKLQFVITHKQQFIEPVPYISLHMQNKLLFLLFPQQIPSNSRSYTLA